MTAINYFIIFPLQIRTNAKLRNLAEMEEVVKIFLEAINVPAELVIQERTVRKVTMTGNKLFKLIAILKRNTTNTDVIYRPRSRSRKKLCSPRVQIFLLWTYVAGV